MGENELQVIDITHLQQKNVGKVSSNEYLISWKLMLHCHFVKNSPLGWMKSTKSGRIYAQFFSGVDFCIRSKSEVTGLHLICLNIIY